MEMQKSEVAELPEVNHEKEELLEKILNSKDNFFITGNAGTGKSVLLKHLRARGKEKGRNVAVLAPTGIAALNVGGQTIHSFFKFPIEVLSPDIVHGLSHDEEIIELFENLDLLIIDEVSMVRADLFSAIDILLQKYRASLFEESGMTAFGGVQVVLFGDLCQIAPVLTPKERDSYFEFFSNRFFFANECYRNGNFQYFQLQEIFRQKNDVTFTNILNKIRSDNLDSEGLNLINARLTENINKDNVTLVSTNLLVSQINAQRLAELSSEAKSYAGIKSGNFPPSSLPTEENLELKIGARVMLLKNMLKQGLANGSLGVVEALNNNSVTVSFDGLGSIDIESAGWENLSYSIKKGNAPDVEEGVEEDRKLKELVAEPIGSYRQIPLKLAWAMTIHKSQGLTFNKINIDLGRGAFEHGQLYVALSRCTSLEGITLARKVKNRDVLFDKAVFDFEDLS